MKFILLISLPLYALDQVTKWLVLQNVRPEDSLDPNKFFNLVNVTNTGAAFGSFRIELSKVGFMVKPVLGAVAVVVAAELALEPESL